LTESTIYLHVEFTDVKGDQHVYKGPIIAVLNISDVTGAHNNAYP